MVTYAELCEAFGLNPPVTRVVVYGTRELCGWFDAAPFDVIAIESTQFPYVDDDGVTVIGVLPIDAETAWLIYKNKNKKD